MAVAYDAVAIPAAELYEATFSWTHTPVGTPKGVAVIVVQENAPDQVSGVTYGGVAMTRVRADINATAEIGRVYIYFLGSGIPAGAQTVTVTLTDVEDCNAVSLTVTAAADTAVDVHEGGDPGVIADPSLSISPTVDAVIFYGFYSGLAAPVTTVQAGSTHVAGKDLGQESAMWARKSVSAGATTIGYTAAADDVCHSALAIKEAGAQTFYQSLPATAIGLGVLTRANSFYRTLPSSAVGVAVLSKGMYMTIDATAIGVALLSTAKMFSKALDAVALGVATLTRITTYQQIISATAVGVSVLTKTATHYLTLASLAIGIPQLLKGMSKTLSATAIGSSVLNTTLTASRTLGATAIGQVVLDKSRLSLVSLVAVAVGIAGLVTEFIAGAAKKRTRFLSKFLLR